MTTTEITEPTPAELHHSIAIKMTVSRGTLLAVLLGPRDLLDERLQERITRPAQEVDFTLNNIANGYNIETNRAQYRQSHYELVRAVTDAGITAYALHALTMMLDDYRREAELLATLAPAVLTD